MKRVFFLVALLVAAAHAQTCPTDPNVDATSSIFQIRSFTVGFDATIRTQLNWNVKLPHESSVSSTSFDLFRSNFVSSPVAATTGLDSATPDCPAINFVSGSADGTCSMPWSFSSDFASRATCFGASTVAGSGSIVDEDQYDAILRIKRTYTVSSGQVTGVTRTVYAYAGVSVVFPKTVTVSASQQVNLIGLPTNLAGQVVLQRILYTAPNWVLTFRTAISYPYRLKPTGSSPYQGSIASPIITSGVPTTDVAQCDTNPTAYGTYCLQTVVLTIPASTTFSGGNFGCSGWTQSLMTYQMNYECLPGTNTITPVPDCPATNAAPGSAPNLTIATGPITAPNACPTANTVDITNPNLVLNSWSDATFNTAYNAFQQGQRIFLHAGASAAGAVPGIITDISVTGLQVRNGPTAPWRTFSTSEMTFVSCGTSAATNTWQGNRCFYLDTSSSSTLNNYRQSAGAHTNLQFQATIVTTYAQSKRSVQASPTRSGTATVTVDYSTPASTPSNPVAPDGTTTPGTGSNVGTSPLTGSNLLAVIVAVIVAAALIIGAIIAAIIYRRSQQKN